VGKLSDHVTHEGTIHGFAGGERLGAEEVLLLPVDVLVPAAIGEVIHAGNVDRVQARLIVEGANHPLTPWADAALYDRGVMVVPDILANAGGVLTSYFEWVQNIQQFRWEEDEVTERLTARMVTAYRSVRELASDRDLSLREAAFLLAVARVAEATALRGLL
jgi:glutamate dehydrogenase (NAD(P)+)